MEEPLIQVYHLRVPEGAPAPDTLALSRGEITILQALALLRSSVELKKMGLKPATHGGATVAVWKDAETGEEIDRYIAFCAPTDAYNKRIGRAIAVGRLRMRIDEPANKIERVFGRIREVMRADN